MVVTNNFWQNGKKAWELAFESIACLMGVYRKADTGEPRNLPREREFGEFFGQ